jgi:hypothetical protein
VEKVADTLKSIDGQIAFLTGHGVPNSVAIICRLRATFSRRCGGKRMSIAKLAPTLASLVALLFSAYTLYESSLRGARLSIFVAPRIDYTDPDRPEDVREVFILPITVANDGARTGTLLALNLEVTNPRTGHKKMFYAARLGTWGETPLRPFAPVVLAGRGIFSHAVQFEPRKGETVPRILDLEPGKYNFKLTVENVASTGGLGGGGAVPLEFEMQNERLDYRRFQGTGTMEMWAADYQSFASIPR